MTEPICLFQHHCSTIIRKLINTFGKLWFYILLRFPGKFMRFAADKNFPLNCAFNHRNNNFLIRVMAPVNSELIPLVFWTLFYLTLIVFYMKEKQNNVVHCAFYTSNGVAGLPPFACRLIRSSICPDRMAWLMTSMTES